MGWYADIDVDDDTFYSLSGWRVFTLLAGDRRARWCSPASTAGSSCWPRSPPARRCSRWPSGGSRSRCRRCSALLAAGQLLLNLQADEGEQLAGIWCSVIVFAAAAFAWGNLVPYLREAETEALYAGTRRSGRR